MTNASVLSEKKTPIFINPQITFFLPAIIPKIEKIGQPYQTSSKKRPLFVNPLAPCDLM